MNTFWKTIGWYNSATWIFQIIIVLTGILLTAILIRKPQPRIKLAMKIYLIAVYLWISIVYYLIYCADRSYNGVTAFFWGVMALAWVWDALTGHTTFEYNKKYKTLAYILLLLPFGYPVFSLLRGMNFPEITSPVMPCSVVTFSVGLMLLYSRKINIFIVILLCHWSMIGLTKTYFFKIPEDFILASILIPASYLFLREYFLEDLHKETKPNAKIINGILITLCTLIGIVLFSTLFSELSKDLQQ